MVPLYPSSSAPSHTSVSTKSHLSPSFRDKSPQRRRSEKQENSRIMDPLYFAGTSDKFNRGYPCYVDSDGHLHDIDYRPFPKISSTSKPHFSDGGFQTPSDFKRAQASSFPQSSSSRTPYWETFMLAQHLDEEDPTESSQNIPTSFNTAEQQQACVYQSYAEYSDQCKSNWRLRLEHATRCSPTKVFAGVEDGEGEDGEDDDEEKESHVVAGLSGDKERRRGSRPTETLKTTWAKAKFSTHLTLIRAQRRFKRYIHNKN